MFKSFSLASLVLLAAALFFSGVSAQGKVNIIRSGLSPSKCLQVRNSKLANGTAVESWDCNTSTSQWQQWSLSTGITQVKVAAPCPGAQYCLAANKFASLSGVVIQPCSNSALQQWNYSGGLLKLANNNTLCLDVRGSNTTNGLQLIVYSCHGGPNQNWKAV